MLPTAKATDSSFTNITLLAASTLAQTASMAALSSRRRAFFSFALLDFLWTQEMRKGGVEEWRSEGNRGDRQDGKED